jgi:hypothetical protein
MHDSLRRCVIANFSLICLSSAGCLQVPYFLPELSYAPSVGANCKSKEVYAFRVDVTQKSEIKEGAAAMRGEVVELQQLTRIRTSSDGTTSAQMGLTFASGWRYVGVVNYTALSTDHGIALRFYRPGYETIVVKPGETVRDLQWKEAPDLSAQVKAVDDLMNGPRLAESARVSVRQVLEPGTKSASHKEVLLFAAGEYERLAGDLSSANPDERGQHAQLLNSANRLRALAEAKKDRD